MFTYTVNAVRSHLLTIFIESQKIVIAVVNQELVRAHNIAFTLLTLYLLRNIIYRGFQIFEVYLLRRVLFISLHCVVDRGDVIDYLFIIGLHSVCQKSIVLNRVGLILAHKIAEHTRKSFRLSF